MNVGFASLARAPGASTLWRLAGTLWPAPRRLLIEADPDGGCIALLTGLTLDPDHPSLTTLVAALRHGGDDELVWRHTQTLPGEIPIVPVASVAEQAVRAVAGLVERWPTIAAALAATADILIDLGRLRPGSPAVDLAAGLDVTVVVVRSRLVELEPLLTQIAILATRAPIAIVVRGDTPYGEAEIRTAIDARTDRVKVLGTVAEDRRAATMLEGGGPMAGGWLRRSPLVRTATTVVAAIAATRPCDVEVGR